MNLKIIAVLIYFFSSVIISQTDTLSLSSDEIQSLVDKIGIKILLNDDQKSELSKILLMYSSEFKKLRLEGSNSEESRNKLIKELDAEIKLILDNKQQMKYDILKKDWLESLKIEEKD
jgi:hypothetical protein